MGRNAFMITFMAIVLVAGLSFALLGTSHRGIRAEEDILIRTEDGDHRFSVTIADDDHERARGLMWVRHLDDDEGMLFMFGGEDLRTFWMKNTKIPLDMIFIAEDGRIVSIQRNALPCKADPCPTYPSAGPAKYVLEINGGLADKKHINVGDLVVIGQ